MAWNNDELTRSRDQLLDRTVRRGEHLRRRRRLAWMGAAPAVLLLIAVPAAFARIGDEGDRTTVAATGPASTIATVPPTSVTTVPAPTTAPARATTVPPTTTAPPRTTTTTTEPPTTTMTRDPRLPPGPLCDESVIERTMTFDKATYKPGDVVKVTSTYKNISAQPCYTAGYFQSFNVYDSAGKQVTQPVGAFVDTDSWVGFPAGKVETHQHEWDQLNRYDVDPPYPQVPPGTYRLVEHGAFGESEGTVQLIAG